MSTGARLLTGLNFRMQAMHPEPMQVAHSSHVPRLTASHAVSPRSLINSTFQPSLHQNSPLNSSGGKNVLLPYSVFQWLSNAAGKMQIISYFKALHNLAPSLPSEPFCLPLHPHSPHTAAILHITAGSLGFPQPVLFIIPFAPSIQVLEHPPPLDAS